MKSFEYVNAFTTPAAVRNLKGNAKIFAGGTDLLDLMRKEITRPTTIVNIKNIDRLHGFKLASKGELRLGALATVDEIEAEPLLRRYCTAVSEAAGSIASPQLRNVGTLGGNLCQDYRCWYYRGPFKCLLKGGSECHAEKGENRLHAILGGGPCYAVNPSDLAPALITFDATVKIVGVRGARTIAMEDFFRTPMNEKTTPTTIHKDEIITHVDLRLDEEANVRSTYLKSMDRKAWGFALVSVALKYAEVDGEFAEPRLVLGGVAPKPWRCKRAESLIAGESAQTINVDEVAEAALDGAVPLEHNRYKIFLAKGLIRQAFKKLF
jgi:xanthine dehydrogenase YagS FAD-binding subunit